MNSIDLKVTPTATAPANNWTYLPQKVFIQLKGMCDDDINMCNLLVMTYSFPTVVPPFKTRTVIIQDEMIMPFDDYRSAFNDDGSINITAANALLAGFNLQIV